MSTAIEKRQKFIRYFRRVTGAQEVDMHEVARWLSRWDGHFLNLKIH